MSPNTKNVALGLLFIFFGGLVLYLFINAISGGIPRDENPALFIFLVGLRLLLAASCFYTGISYLRRKN